MSRDWIKVSVCLPRHPKVVRISSALKTDRHRIVGGLVSVWSVFDEQTEDGILAGYTIDMLEEIIGFPGLASAMESEGWLVTTSDSIICPEFDKHMSKSAKRRAVDAVRKKSARDADKDRTRERERERRSTPLPPGNIPEEDPPTGPGNMVQAGPEVKATFDVFWQTYPAWRAHPDTQYRCFQYWQSYDCADIAPDIMAALRNFMESEDWQQENGKYIPGAVKWLSERWWLRTLPPSTAPAPDRFGSQTEYENLQKKAARLGSTAAGGE